MTSPPTRVTEPELSGSLAKWHRILPREPANGFGAAFANSRTIGWLLWRPFVQKCMESIMSKVLMIVVALGLFGEVVLAKDKESKSSSRSGSAPSNAAPRSQPSRSSPVPATTQKSTQVPASAPRGNAKSTPVLKSSPSTPNSPSRSQTFIRTEPTTRRPESRPSTPAPSIRAQNTPIPAAPMPTSKPGVASSVFPFGKIGNGSAQRPAPNNDKPSTSGSRTTDKAKPNQQVVTRNHAEAKPFGSSSNSHGHNPSSPIPAAPKLETKGRIPEFGSPLVGSPNNSTKSITKDHEHKSDSDTRLPRNSIPTAQQTRGGSKDNHDHRDSGDRQHDNHSHNQNQSHHDDHGHNHSHYRGYSSGFRRSNNLSWLIIGNSLFGSRSYGYGYGYGPDYFGPTYVYTAPTQVFVTAPATSSYSAGILAPPQQQQMTPDEFSGLPLGRQRELLLQALNALEEDFARSPNGDDWSRHLQLETIAKLITEGEQAPDATTRARLRSIVQLFDGVAANMDYRAVSELTSFNVLHAGLHEFSAEEIDRSRRQVSITASVLSKSLDAWTSGERWREYLQLSWLIGTDEEMQIDLEARLVRFEKLFDKFNRVQSDDQFQIVTQPGEFGRAHEALRDFVGRLRNLVAEIQQAEQSSPDGELDIPAAPR